GGCRMQATAVTLKPGYGGHIMRLSVSLALAACLAIASSSVAFAQSTIRSLPVQDHLLEGFFAQISYRDLFNSSGIRLSNPWQVLRQDRAKFHRYGLRDPLDEWDSFFGDEANRAIMEEMLSRGSITPQAARDIMSGEALVWVEIHGTGDTG